MITSRRLYSWALETTLSGDVGTAEVLEAARRFRDSGAKVWLLDAGGAAGLTPGALVVVRDWVPTLRAHGLHTIALVLPRFAALLAPSAAALAPGVRVKAFATRRDAARWLAASCP